MKLYTEEQMKLAYGYGVVDGKLKQVEYSNILEHLIPIELPSDEEISYEAITWNVYNMTQIEAFKHGVEWMKEQILNQNIPELRNADGTYGQWGTSGINNQNKK